MTVSARLEQPLQLYRLPLRWLSGFDTPKNLSGGRALAEARALVRVRNPEGTIRKWCERFELEALLEAGWLLA